MPVPSALLGRTRKRDLLLEEQCFISRIRLHVLLERFILHERVIRPEEWIAGERQTDVLQVEDMTYGSIINVPVFLSTYWFGPFHFFQTHFSLRSNLK
jgi:hypothetical protein